MVQDISYDAKRPADDARETIGMRYRWCRRRGRQLTAALLLGMLLSLPAVVQPAEESGHKGRVRCYEGPLYVVPLRIHGGQSGRSREELVRVRKEINRIWLSQAVICFTGEIIDHDKPLGNGLDIWFVPDMERYNGYFSGRDNIRVRDFPELHPVVEPAIDGAARTAAHEIGHGLGLKHRQDADENLMRSKTYGWRLNGEEIDAARRAASAMGDVELNPDCLCPAD